MPVAFSLALTGVAGLVALQGAGALNYAIGQFPVSRIMTYSLSVIPLFILMGQLAFAAGVTNDAYDVAYKFLSRLRGGLCMVTIGACGLFAATTGSSAAEVAAMGKIAIPEMKRYGYAHVWPPEPWFPRERWESHSSQRRTYSLWNTHV